MQVDPVSERQRLTAQYRETSDDALRELAADLNDLTETAQQALRDEMKSRGLNDPANPAFAGERDQELRESSGTRVEKRSTPRNSSMTAGFDYAFPSQPPALVADDPVAKDEDEGPHEYTWKTVLNECETTEQAQLLCDALDRAGIDSWIEGPESGSRYSRFALEYPRVLVAADQLDQARAIAAQPIPRGIVQEPETKVPDYTPPKCPKCGAGDPILEGVDPSNTWRCDQCGERWSDPLPDGGQTTPGTGQNPL